MCATIILMLQNGVKSEQTAIKKEQKTVQQLQKVKQKNPDDPHQIVSFRKYLQF